MSFFEAISTCFKKYVTFSGRARRSEYWFFMLFNIIVSSVLSLIFGSDSILASLFSLALFLPGLSVVWRRLHDINKSGGFYFFCLIPIVGWIFLLVWLCRDSDPETNRFGENPKA